MNHLRAQRRKIKLPRGRFPSAIERQYEAALRTLVDATWSAIWTEMRQMYPILLREQSATMRSDGWYDTLASAVSRFFFGTEGAESWAKGKAAQAAEDVAAASSKQWQAAARAATGVNLFQSEEWLRPLTEEWSSENSKLITSIRREFLDDVAARTADFVRQGKSLADYTKELRRLYDVTAARARLIARTEVAKLNASITETRQRRVGVEEYKWNSASDERVRPSHRVLDGKICRWDDSTVYRNADDTVWRKRSSLGGYAGKPGTDYQCRCVADPVVDALVDTLLKDVA